MRILHVAPSIGPRDGGPSSGLIALCRELTLLGHKVDCSATDRDGKGRLKSVKLLADAQAHGYDVHLHRAWQPYRFRFAPGQVFFLWSAIARADAIAIHSIYDASSVLAAAICRLRRRRYSIHANGVFEPYQRDQKVLKKRLARPLVGLVVRGASTIICADESEAAGAAQLSFVNRCDVVPLGSEEPATVARKADRPTVLFLARIAPKKRLDLVLDAWPLVLQAVPDGILHIAGDADGPYAREVRSTHSGKQTSWLGHVEGAEKDRVLTSSWVYVLPSDNESFGISVAEALAAGLAPVVTKHVALSAAIARCKAGIVLETQSAPAVAQALIELLLDKEGRVIFERRARELWESEFTWPVCAARYANLLSSLR